jgi:hypothetical protein
MLANSFILLFTKFIVLVRRICKQLMPDSIWFTKDQRVKLRS